MKRDLKQKKMNDHKQFEFMDCHVMGMESFATAMMSKQDLAKKREEKELMKEIGGNMYQQYLMAE